MSSMEIKGFKIQLNTALGDYGFNCEFKSGLNIIRGNNSTGKSTLINALIYSLGMEEILGGKGEKTLPYALKEYVENELKSKVKIISSYVYVEVSNFKGSIVTFKRAISSPDKDTKLIEVIQGNYVTQPIASYAVMPKFLHDKGSAQNVDSGFFSYLENFIGLNLPTVSSSNGGEVKLYLQTIFSALLVEQKRGWTDYIANTPYYAIRDVRTKIVEFLLGLDVFENDKRKSKILSDLTSIQLRWAEEKAKVRLLEENQSISVLGIKSTADDVFDKNLVRISKKTDDLEVELHEYISDLVRRVESIELAENRNKEDASADLIDSYSKSRDTLDQLISMFDSANAELRLAKSRLAEYLSVKLEIEKDLEKNKIAQKLKKFGAQQDLSIASDNCPTCHQNIDDSLFLAETLMQPMSIEENVKYLESQRNMVTRYIFGSETSIRTLEAQLRELSERLAEQRTICLSLKKGIRASSSATESDLRIKLQLEANIERLSLASKNVDDSISVFKRLSVEFMSLKIESANIPERKQSDHDIKKYKNFQEHFRHYAGLFGYKSAPTSDIEINKDTLFPYLAGLELRQVNTDIKSDSSASDFVRLIWAYLLSVFSTSNELDGNHVGLVVFDEPAQHSMGVTSVNELLKVICKQRNLQGIIAASFDESDEVFEESVVGVNYHLISFEGRLLRPITSQ